MRLQCKSQLTHRRGAENAELRRVNPKLNSKELQPRALRAPSTLTPTLSHEYAGEGAKTGMLPLPLPLPLAGEGWGEGVRAENEELLKEIPRNQMTRFLYEPLRSLRLSGGEFESSHGLHTPIKEISASGKDRSR